MTRADEPGETDDSLRHHLAHARRRNESVDLLRAARRHRRRERRPYQGDAAGHRQRVPGAARKRLGAPGHGRLRPARPAALRARLSDVVGFPLNIGWARFPEDGYTLGVLVAQARAALEPAIPAAPPAWGAPEARSRSAGRSGDRGPGSGGHRVTASTLTVRRALVTGCAGFLGSHLSERLIAHNVDVIGVDRFSDYYEPWLKERNIERLLDASRFRLVRANIATDSIDSLLEGVDVVFHLAARAGVRGSFGTAFARVPLGQRDGHAAPARSLCRSRSARLCLRVVFFRLRPCHRGCRRVRARNAVSAYGATKMAVEDLTGLYHRTEGLPVIGMRYFTVYGPRQRPDMAFSRFIARALLGEPMTVYGDGSQRRDFTYVDDEAIDATMAAADVATRGRSTTSARDTRPGCRWLISMVQELLGRRSAVEHLPPVRGMRATPTPIVTLAKVHLGVQPRWSLRDGLEQQVRWTVEVGATEGSPVSYRSTAYGLVTTPWVRSSFSATTAVSDTVGDLRGGDPGPVGASAPFLDRRGWRSASFSEAGTGTRTPRRTLAITFDDAYRSVQELALPIVAAPVCPRRYSRRPTSRAGGRALDGNRSLDRRTVTARAAADVLDRPGELADAGWEIGSHTSTHPHLTEFDDTTLQAELTDRAARGRTSAARAPRSPTPTATSTRASRRSPVARGTKRGRRALSSDLRLRGHYRYPRIGVYRRDTGGASDSRRRRRRGATARREAGVLPQSRRVDRHPRRTRFHAMLCRRVTARVARPSVARFMRQK